tara:strand:- start:223 stop:504 length:282 start_codon:yes stop_codon:yes gene_type:complete
MLKMININNKEPMHEASIIPHGLVDKLRKIGLIPDAITKRATPKPDPELIPKMWGPANGFLKRVCICKPLTDKAAPAIRAVIALGNLISLKII